MIIDLILLIIITSLFFLFLSQQTGKTAFEAQAISNQNSYAHELLTSTLQYNMNSTYENATVAELINAFHCGNTGVKADLNQTINSVISSFGKKDYYFILKSQAPGAALESFGSCSSYIESNYSCCVKIEKITLANFDLNLTCNSTASISLGVWPKSIEVKPC